MAIESTLIQDEINRILHDGEKPVSFYWSAVVHANGKDIPLFSLEDHTIERDYDKAYTDGLQVRGKIGSGTLNVDVVPFKSTLEITLTKSVARESGEEEILGKPVEVERFKASLIEEAKTSMQGAVSGNYDKNTADLGGYVTCVFQLMNPTIAQLRMITIGGIYRNNTPGNLLRFLLGKESRKVSTPKSIAIRGVDMAAPNNEKVRDHFVIPPMKLLGLPDWMQNEGGGMYSSGIGFYLQSGLWYVYPKLDVKRFNTKAKTLTIIIVPENKYPGITRTYRETANQLIILSTRGIRHVDDSEQQQLNIGNGVRFTDADKIMEGFGTTEGNKFTTSRASNNSELVLSKREDGINRAMVSDTPISCNAFVEYSKLTRANCTHLQVTWEHSLHNLIYPGMPTRVVYANSEEITESYGCVLGTDTVIGRAGDSAIVRRHESMTAVTVILEKK